MLFLNNTDFLQVTDRNNDSFVPQIKKIGSDYILRCEKNGITVYNRITDQYVFYETLKMSQIDENISCHEFQLFIDSHQKNISRNIDFSAPFRVNWLIENRCNLDCVYCFASDKITARNRNDLCTHMNTINILRNLGVMNVGLTGGEPTLYPELQKIILELSKFSSVIIDTNGATDCFNKSLLDVLKAANVLVRISVDSFEKSIIDIVRPPLCNLDTPLILHNNITNLIENRINTLVHTVVTRYNINRLHILAQELVNLGVKRWHIYGVHKSEKCSEIYDEIKVSLYDLTYVVKELKTVFGNHINITMFMDEEKFSANSILFVDYRGRFFIDSVQNGVQYISMGSDNPAKAIANILNVNSHCNDYLTVDV